MLLDLGRSQLIRGDEGLRLSPAHCRMIETLARCRDAATYDHLCSKLWPEDEPGDPLRVLKVQVCKLRRAVRLRGWPPLIRCVWRVGYCLHDPVEVREHEPSMVIPAELQRSLRRLLLSHPDHAAADRILLAVGS